MEDLKWLEVCLDTRQGELEGAIRPGDLKGEVGGGLSLPFPGEAVGVIKAVIPLPPFAVTVE